MQNNQLLRSALLIISSFGLLVGSAVAQQATSSTAAGAGMVVTIEARHGSTPPTIYREDVMVYEGHNRDQVTNWIPLQGSHAGLELFILMDDGLSESVGTQLNDLQKFINSQPATTAIGVGYMRNGRVVVAQNLTNDHTQAAKALRLPLGERGIDASPYLSLADLIKRWPDHQERREVLMISDGIDTLYGGGPDDPYVDQAIEEAQKAEVIVFSIYSRGDGHYGHTFWLINWGQNYESELAEETGGESYYLGFGNPVSFVPYLDDLTKRLTRQYLLTFVPKPQKKAGARRVKLTTEVPNAELVAAEQIYAPAE